MRIKLDENLPHALKELLESRGHSVHTLTDENLGCEPDDQVWAGAQAEQTLLMTQDLDFSDMRIFEPGKHHGVVIVRLREPGRSALLKRIQCALEDDDIATWSRCLVVITDRKIRIRRPTVLP